MELFWSFNADLYFIYCLFNFNGVWLVLFVYYTSTDISSGSIRSSLDCGTCIVCSIFSIFLILRRSGVYDKLLSFNLALPPFFWGESLYNYGFLALKRTLVLELKFLFNMKGYRLMELLNYWQNYDFSSHLASLSLLRTLLLLLLSHFYFSILSFNTYQFVTYWNSWRGHYLHPKSLELLIEVLLVFDS